VNNRKTFKKGTKNNDTDQRRFTKRRNHAQPKIPTPRENPYDLPLTHAADKNGM